MYDGKTFDSPIQMNYGYYGYVAIKVNGRIRNFAIERDCWLGIIKVDSRNTRPCYIMGIENENGSIVADNNFYYYGASYPITFSANNLSIETIDGVEGGITCTRQGTGTHTTELKYFAYEDSVPTKTSDLTNDSGFVTSSALDVKRDLSDMKVKGVPQNTNAQSWFTIKYGTTTENAWYYDEGRWESGSTLHVLAASATMYTLQKLQDSQWTNIGEFQLDNNAEATVTYDGVTYSITGYVGEIVVSNQLPEIPHYIPFTIKQDKGLYPTSQTITVKTSPTKTLTVATNPNGSGGTFVANFLTSGWNDSTTLADVVTAPDTAGCFVFSTSGQLNDTWGNLKSTLISTAESFEVALPL